jgi:hypothetical protein
LWRSIKTFSSSRAVTFNTFWIKLSCEIGLWLTIIFNCIKIQNLTFFLFDASSILSCLSRSLGLLTICLSLFLSERHISFRILPCKRILFFIKNYWFRLLICFTCYFMNISFILNGFWWRNLFHFEENSCRSINGFFISFFLNTYWQYGLSFILNWLICCIYNNIWRWIMRWVVFYYHMTISVWTVKLRNCRSWLLLFSFFLLY